MQPGELWEEAYGIRTTAADMVRFIAENMNLVAIDPAYQRAIDATHTGYFTVGPMTQDLIWEEYAYPVARKTVLDGTAMIEDVVPATEMHPPESAGRDGLLNKTGSTNGFAAYAAFVPAKHLGVVILANKNFSLLTRVSAAYEILTALSAANERDADPPKTKPTVVLQRSDVPGTNWGLGLGVADFLPNAQKPRHFAIGPEVGYVLAGELTIRQDGKPSRTVRAGESFAIPAGVVHVTIAGPNGAKVLAAWTNQRGKPFNIPIGKPR
jgi:quercetin dioxygenase-like cupin family protein